MEMTLNVVQVIFALPLFIVGFCVHSCMKRKEHSSRCSYFQVCKGLRKGPSTCFIQTTQRCVFSLPSIIEVYLITSERENLALDT